MPNLGQHKPNMGQHRPPCVQQWPASANIGPNEARHRPTRSQHSSILTLARHFEPPNWCSRLGETPIFEKTSFAQHQQHNCQHVPHLGLILASSWPLLTSSWPILALSWPHLAPDSTGDELPGGLLGPTWPHIGPIWANLGHLVSNSGQLQPI